MSTVAESRCIYRITHSTFLYVYKAHNRILRGIIELLLGLCQNCYPRAGGGEGSKEGLTGSLSNPWSQISLFDLNSMGTDTTDGFLLEITFQFPPAFWFPFSQLPGNTVPLLSGHP